MPYGRLFLVFSILLQLLPSDSLSARRLRPTLFRSEALAARAFSERLPWQSIATRVRREVLENARTWRQIALGDARIQRFYTVRAALPGIVCAVMALAAVASLSPMNYRLLYAPPNGAVLAIAS